jgi:2-amino-4-hydroxy-6-hydroxymethyldihydropteridine diphosphokinase
MRAFIALGSNLGDSKQQLLDAIEKLSNLPNSHVLARSHLYRTPPWGKLEQPDFLNAVVVLETPMLPHDLLDALLQIEREAGRLRNGERWGPRTLDLDLLHVACQTVNDERLTLPHPHISERAFVLLPLNELAPDLEIPGQGRVNDLLRAVDTQGCEAMA